MKILTCCIAAFWLVMTNATVHADPVKTSKQQLRTAIHKAKIAAKKKRRAILKRRGKKLIKYRLAEKRARQTELSRKEAQKRSTYINRLNRRVAAFKARVKKSPQNKKQRLQNKKLPPKYSGSQLKRRQSKLYANQGFLWSKPDITVCWENPGFVESGYRDVAESTARDTWQKHSMLYFPGWNNSTKKWEASFPWGDCALSDAAGSPANIRIKILNSGNGGAYGVGTQLDGKENGIELNLKKTDEGEEKRIREIEWQTAHEFGHAIGFLHEQDRHDSECDDTVDATYLGNLNVTEYDGKSVMNYCTKDYRSRKEFKGLSELDIVGLQRVYGRSGDTALPDPATSFLGALAGYHPKCDHVTKSRTSDCVAAISRACNNVGFGRAGVSQEVGDNAFGVACFNPGWYGDVSLSDLTDKHSGCNHMHKSQSSHCVAAVHRWCHDKGYGGAGMVQELGNGKFGVACFRPSWYGDVSVTGLKGKHKKCDNVNKSRSSDCVAAVYRWCHQDIKAGAGITQEVGKGVFGVACFNPRWYGDVSLNDLKARHSECNKMHKSQSPDCMAAVHRWCHKNGKGGAGIAQELGHGKFGVACFNPRWYGDVSLSDLKARHSGCDHLSKSQSAGCMAAVHRWCHKKGKGGAGIVQEVGDGKFGVACFNPRWYDDVPLNGFLPAEHSKCDAATSKKAQGSDCVAAVHRWCHKKGKGGAGIVQEIGNGKFGVACFHPSWYGDMAVK